MKEVVKRVSDVDRGGWRRSSEFHDARGCESPRGSPRNSSF